MHKRVTCVIVIQLVAGVLLGMDKRLAKRHKRQVARARERVRVSEPDVRTHEQIEAAREASRPDLSRDGKPKAAPAAR